ncbi:tetratricopeptide repeat protein [Paracoccus sulfuroxidans]|uniref:Tetratricopeptide repeat protein n=1 Tax=Paracoccus sulfuroxidans TaxID=384678 RepID=A0A562NFY0_9RHOB|nr:tetratricopeptide repeat protein [Paracoccus sulfuroxidans]TWI31004.1 tetratricopeptide repeat protein [Paracoccus sulfuroxidans]
MNKTLISLALIALTSMPLSAQDAPATPEAPETGTPAPEGQGATPAGTAGVDSPIIHGLAGPYLAARMAAMQNDFRVAADYYLSAMAQDDTDAYLQDSALVALISAGEMDRAIALSTTMNEQGRATQLALLVQRAQLAHAERWDDLIAQIDKTAPASQDSPDGGGFLLDNMLKAWALLGAGKASDALAEFEKLSKIQGARPMVNYHLALAKAKVGDFEGAEALLQDEATGAHIMGVIARAEVLSQLERNKDAIAMLEAVPGFSDEPMLITMRDEMVKGETLPFDAVRSPADGIAQVFLTFGSVLASNDEPDPLALIHARLATYMAPDLGEARLLAAQLLQSYGQFDLAEAEFDSLRELGDMRPVAELTRIDSLARVERLVDAEKAALALTAEHPELASGWIALGDLLRQQEKFAQAVPAYDKAISLLKDAPGDARWFPLYARGIALERSAQFDKAERDFRAALELHPNSAQVLNYLGYSYVDRNEKLDEALKLIQRAVELRPDDGYIVDSLAWAYFRLGRYEEAVAPMERAVSVMSSDPLVNDHMGDIYWMVGRHREAEIQWQRALSLKPETEEEAHRIRTKLEQGLDAVLAEEKANGGKLPQTHRPEPRPSDVGQEPAPQAD